MKQESYDFSRERFKKGIDIIMKKQYRNVFVEIGIEPAQIET